MKPEYFNRELSWLSFNYRVLQEAKDKTTPIMERLKFLAIYSSNLDEFFRVRVASLRSLLELKKKKRRKIDFDPAALLKKINTIVKKQQDEFGSVFRNEILPGLMENNIFLIDETKINKSQSEFVEEYFRKNLLPYTSPQLLSGKKVSLFLKNKGLYLSVKLLTKGRMEKKRTAYAIVEIPAEKFPRFVVLPDSEGKSYLMFLDDIIRKNLSYLFPGYTVAGAYAIKLTRDADLYIDDEFSGDLLNKIKDSLSKRHTGLPCRFLYEESIPAGMLKYLKNVLELDKKDLIPGARYHNFNDFFTFPNLIGKEAEYEPSKPLPCKEFDNIKFYFEKIKQSDVLLHFPYQKYDYVLNLLDEAANDIYVKSIQITLYRTAADSKVVSALCRAALNGKNVTAFIEVKARFDEEANIRNADELKKAGVKVLFSFPGLKVHAKICLISRLETEKEELYAYVSTGNFNEKTARVYSDFGLFTSNKKITTELVKIFRFLSKESDNEVFENLLVAPFNLRESFISLINNEIRAARKGDKGEIVLKLNSLEDKKMIKHLYKASMAGVKIRIIVRGICCLVPGIKGLSENIKVTSIVDRFLEHSRIYRFYNRGEVKLYLSSADWMTRNLKRRIELCFPVYDTKVKTLINKVLELQISDNVKSRIINSRQSNPYSKSRKKGIRAQSGTVNLLQFNPSSSPAAAES